jgi:transketolase
MSLQNLASKWKAFGWQVLEIETGNHMEEVIKILQLAKGLTHREQPVVILLKTEMGFGVDFMMGSHKWHGVAPNDEELERALQQLPVTLGDY